VVGENRKTNVEVLTRLRRVEGQIRGIQRMIEEHRNCEDVITQLMAARAALDKAGLLIVTRYLDECLQSAEVDADDKERLHRIFELLLKF